MGNITLDFVGPGARLALAAAKRIELLAGNIGAVIPDITAAKNAALADIATGKNAALADIAAPVAVATGAATTATNKAAEAQGYANNVNLTIAAIGVATVVAAGGTEASTNTQYPYDPSPTNGTLGFIDVAIVASAGATVMATVVVSTVNGDGTLKRTAMKQVPLVNGLNSLVPVGLPIAVGQIWGVYGASVIRSLTGQAQWYTVGLTGTVGDAKTIVAARGLQMKGYVYADNALALKQGQSAYNDVGYSDVVGVAEPSATAASVNTGITAYTGVPLPRDGNAVAEFYSNAAVADPNAKLVISTLNADGTLSATTTLPITVFPGRNRVTYLSAQGLAGQYVGVYTVTSGIARNSPPAGPDLWFTAGLTGTNTAKSMTSNYGLQLKVTVSSGVRSTVATLAGQFGGLTADNTGTTDATSGFFAARSNHPTPYVPRGDYAVTALPFNGEGFWGPGRVFLNGQRFFLPGRPTRQGLQKRARSTLARQIGNMSALIYAGDSTTQDEAGITDINNSWVRQVCAFLNIFSSPGDLPIETQFGTIYNKRGFTTTGTISTAYGPSRGALLLAAGQYIEWTGTHAFVDVFYEQFTGGGDLLFSADGGATTYRTVATAGTAQSDKLSYDGSTGTGFPAAAKTYRITAGTAGVRITGLIRWAAQVVSSGYEQRRLPVINIGHDSEQFSSVTAASMASAWRQGTAFGGDAPELSWGYGVNDGRAGGGNLTYAALKANATTAIGLATAAGFTPGKLQAGRLPIRPGAGNFANFATGKTVDAMYGAIKAAFEDAGITRVTPNDARDWTALGEMSDTLHTNDNGKIAYALIELETLAGVL